MSIHPNLILSSEEIRDLTTRPIISYRTSRYQGGEFNVRLDRDLGDEEVELVTEFYNELKRLLELSRPKPESLVHEASRAAALESFFENTRLIRLASELEQVAVGAERTADRQLVQILRELTGGAFHGIYAIVQLTRARETPVEGFSSLYYLTRDHLKIMRTLIPDLDPVARAKDEQTQTHSIELMTEKWDGARFRADNRVIEVRFDSSFSGNVAERCVEFAEVDRLIYQLMQNAVQHGMGEMLQCQVDTCDGGANLRWVLTNPISPESRLRLLELIADGHSLFDAGTSLNGKGWGLNVVAQSVSNAYGLAGNAFGEEVGYYGVRIGKEHFVIWFHWPVAAED